MTEDDKEVYQKGVALLEEWEDVNYCEHSFKFKDEWLTDKEVVDKLNELTEENEWLFKCVENQSALIHELDSRIMAYNMEHKITIKLTEKDLKTLDKALSYYTHQKVEE